MILYCADFENTTNIRNLFMEEIKCNQVAQINSSGYTEMTGRVYDKNGLSPSIRTFAGWNTEVKVLEEPLAYDEQNGYLREDGIVGTLTTDGSSPKHNNRVVEPIVIGNYHKSNHEARRIISRESISPTIKENHGTITAVDEPLVYDGFNQQVKADSTTAGTITRKVGADLKRNGQGIIEPCCVASRGRNPQGSAYEQSLEVNPSGTTNALTTVQKDNMVIEPTIWGSLQEHCAVKQDGVCPTLTQAMGAGGGQIPMHNYDFRVRKLTEKECFRLQGVKDEDFAKIRKNQSKSSCYHLAGDSITTSVLMALFGEMLGVEWKSKVNALTEELKD